jgi:hypothetical protein
MARPPWIHPKSVLWSVPGESHRAGVTISRREVTMHTSKDGKNYFGSRVVAVRETEIDSRIFEGGFSRVVTFARSLAPAAIVNDALCLRVTGDGIMSYVVAEVFPTRFSYGEEDNPLAVGIIPDAIRYAD